jgi:hypothetical protein
MIWPPTVWITLRRSAGKLEERGVGLGEVIRPKRSESCRGRRLSTSISVMDACLIVFRQGPIDAVRTSNADDAAVSDLFDVRQAQHGGLWTARPFRSERRGHRTSHSCPLMGHQTQSESWHGLAALPLPLFTRLSTFTVDNRSRALGVVGGGAVPDEPEASRTLNVLNQAHAGILRHFSKPCGSGPFDISSEINILLWRSRDLTHLRSIELTQ